MARIVGGIACSHVPAIGAALDKGTAGNPYWKPYFDGTAPAREWLAKLEPDVAILIYNDHANALSLEMIPTFLLGTAADFPRGRRRLRRAAGTGGARTSEARLAPGREPDPRRVRHDHRQRDAGRSRPHRAAVASPAASPTAVAVQGHPAVRERDPVSAADRRALLQARPGDPPRGRGFTPKTCASSCTARAACRTSCRASARAS